MRIISSRLKNQHILLLLIVGIALLRLLTLALYPLMDTTEARYAEIGRKMFELQDWITPWSEYAVPFWGKPPLSFWMTAISFSLFGVNEFAARLPHYLCGLLVIWLVWQWVYRQRPSQALYAVVLLSSSLLYFVSSGFVMTDMWLVLATTLSMRGFWAGVNQDNAKTEPGSPHWQRWLLFIGLGIGLLAKGPVAIVLTGLPIALWMLLSGKYALVWRGLPWLYGTLLTAVIAVPWYLLAEWKTPGYLNYFIIGENIQRFLVPGWQGDLYGTAHDFPKGTIWLFMLADWLPWSLILPFVYLVLRYRKKQVALGAEDKSWRLYLLVWGISPALFFSFAGNILWPYVLPGFPGLALWLAYWLDWQTGLAKQTKHRLMVAGLCSTLLLAIVTLITLSFSQLSEQKSAKSLVALYQDQMLDNGTLFYYGKLPSSAAFYSQGSAHLLTTPEELLQLQDKNHSFIAINKNRVAALLTEITPFSLCLVGERGQYQLLRVCDNSQITP